MNVHPKWRSSLVGFLTGVVVLVLVTAILAAAVSSSHTSGTVSSLSRQLEHANAQLERNNAQLDQLRADYAAEKDAAAAARRGFARQNHRLSRTVRVLVDFLRSNGLQVPKIASDQTAQRHPTIASPEDPRPKAPASRPPKHSPATPAPTAAPSPTATPGPTGALCDVLHLTPC